MDELRANGPGLERRWPMFFPLTAAIAAVAVSWWWLDNDVARQVGQTDFRKEPFLGSSSKAGDREGSSGLSVLAPSSEAARLQEDALRIMQDLQRSQMEERRRSDLLERDLAVMRDELERQVSISERASAHAREFKQAAEAATATLQHEQHDARMLVEELATVRRELDALSAGAARAIGDNAATVRELAQLRAVLQQLQEQKAIGDEILVREAARARDLEQKGAAPSALLPAEIPAGPPEPGASTQPSAPVATQGTRSTATTEQSASQISAGATASSPDVPHLMTRARDLLRQGDIAAARNVLERAAEGEDAAALYALAETFDPAVLRSWDVFGTRGDAARARDLYARALAGGIHEAGKRLAELSRP